MFIAANKQLRIALRAGLTAYSATLLVVALFASPIVATHFDFGHVHTSDTAAHSHSLVSVFASAPSLNIALPDNSLALIFILIAGSSTVVANVIRQLPVGSRAPPVAL